MDFNGSKNDNCTHFKYSQVALPSAMYKLTCIPSEGGETTFVMPSTKKN